MQKLDNDSSVVVVTGVSSGIGKAIVTELVAAGTVVFGSVRKRKDAEELSATLGDRFRPLVFDVRERKDVRQAVQGVESQLNGRVLSGLVNNAGIAAFGPMELLDDEDFETSMNVNLIGVRNVTNAFLPLLRGSGIRAPGKIINISSLSGIVNTPMNGAYCVSKHALESLADIYRRELLPAGIDVVSIRSGPIQSEIWSKSRDEEEVCKDVAYQKMATKARRIMAQAEEDAFPASAMANTVIDILSGRKKRVAYHLGKGSWVSRLLAVLPTRWADRLITRSLMS